MRFRQSKSDSHCRNTELRCEHLNNNLHKCFYLYTILARFGGLLETASGFGVILAYPRRLASHTNLPVTCVQNFKITFFLIKTKSLVWSGTVLGSGIL